MMLSQMSSADGKLDSLLSDISKVSLFGQIAVKVPQNERGPSKKERNGKRGAGCNRLLDPDA
jgi:hypothetical protein